MKKREAIETNPKRLPPGTMPGEAAVGVSPLAKLIAKKIRKSRDDVVDAQMLVHIEEDH